MASIGLGQSITGSLTPTDTKFAGTNSVYDQYDFTDLDDYRQLGITVTRPTLLNPLNVELRDAVTDQILAEAVDPIGSGKSSLKYTTSPGVKYKLLISGGDGGYTVSTVNGGKATSIVSTSQVQFVPGDDNRGIVGVGTVSADGGFFPLATSTGETLLDTALAPDGQFYGIRSKFLYRIDPKAYRGEQIAPAGGTLVSSIITDPQAFLGSFNGTIDAIEFANDKLYALAGTTTGDKLYTINPANRVATLVGNLPSGLLNKGGDFVYDAANSRFLVTAEGTPGNDALWQIPIANPAGANKIGQIGFADVTAINFENGQLTGISNKPDGTGTKIGINPTTGVGTFGQAISGISKISGSTTIVGANATNPALSNPTASTPNTSTPPTPNLFPTTAAGSIGTKSQGLAEGRIIDLTDYAGKALKVDVTTKGDAAYTNNIGFYQVTDALTGAIQLANGTILKPSDANYAAEAIRSAVIQANKVDSKLGLDVPGGGIYAPVVVAQGSLTDFINKNPTNGGDGSAIHAYFNYLGANPDKFDHFKLTGPNTFAVEDQFGGGDRDFNDLVINTNFRTV
jgi:Domain of unknown function (DUF4114)